MSTEQQNVENLSKIFQDGLDLFNHIDKTDQATNSPEVQVDIKRSMALFERATRLVSASGLFSTNESIDEVSTNDLQYMLLPAFLGMLSAKIIATDRRPVVEVAEIYFRDYLQRCSDYGLCDYEFKEKPSSSKSTSNKTELDQLRGMACTRYNKIQRFREQKELQTKLEELKTNMGNENVDDEIKRNYMLTMIKIFIYKATEEIESIEMEKPMLVHMQKLKEESAKEKKEGAIPRREPPKPKPLRPVIITKNELQKAVFGAGYPSLPTMTVDEFYDKRIRDGIFPDPTKPKTGPIALQEKALAGIDLREEEEEEDAMKEKQVEDDDPELLQRLRDRDEYKDDHRRGWGNRMNRS